jgi:formylglycine-generating enzyme required for sulfatase activity/sugar lactone lactonase YvrE
LETYKPELAVSNDAYSELQLLLREFGPEDIVETLKSGDQTAPFFAALKTKNVLTPGDLISELKNILNGQNMTMEDFVYWASPLLDPPPAGLLNVRGGVFELGSQIWGQVAVFTGQRVARIQIAQYETTWSEWKAVRDWANNNGYDIGSIGSGQGESYPVRYVNWYDVLKWCNAKSESEGQTPVYTFGSNTYKSGQVVPSANSSANGYRLPTEMEWEWAARGGLFSDGYVYSGSNSIDSIAWYYYNSGSAGSPQIYTKSVGTKLPNELDIYDMSGNVEEWCFDTFAFFDSTRARARGGSSHTYDVGCAVIVRGHYALGDRQPTLGFRVARNASVYMTPPPTPTPTPPPTPTPTPSVTVVTVAGSGSRGYKDGDGLNSKFDLPQAIALDSFLNIYVAELNRVRKITPTGTVTTLAIIQESGSRLSGIAVDKEGSIYVSDSAYNKIRKITPDGFITTFAGSGSAESIDGLAETASFNNPTDVAVDNKGNIYVLEYHKVRKISALGVVTTVAGLSIPYREALNYPNGIAVDENENIYVADTSNQNIRKITPSGSISTLAGSGSERSGREDGTGLWAKFSSPTGVAIDTTGNVFVSDYHNHKIRKITPAGLVTTLAGMGESGSYDGQAVASKFYWPMGVAVDNLGNVYVADTWNHKIRKITIPQ